MKKNIKNNAASMLTAFSAFILFFAGLYAVYKKNTTEFVLFFLCGIAILILSFTANKQVKAIFREYRKKVTEHRDGISGNAINKFPIPMVVLQINGRIMWYNELFSDMVASLDIYDAKIEDIMPELRWSEILKSSGEINTTSSYKGKKYDVVGDILKTEISTEENPNYTVLLYFIDKTESEQLLQKYEEEKTDIAIINIDNYEEVFQSMEDSESQYIMSKINKYLVAWVSESNGVLKKTERDRYLVLFEHTHLKEYIQRKFDVLENIRKLGDTTKFPVAISIGIGVGGSIIENDSNARAAIDMALGRGGDQAVVKDMTQYNFYGGIAKDYEKSTRVKTRAFAVAFKEFIKNSDKVFFMGHSGLDYDALGASLGLQRAVRVLEKTPYIVSDNSPAVSKLMEEAKTIAEYSNMFISPEDALSQMTDNTLLVIVDTHRPSLLPNEKLLDRASQVVLIDHHRRSTDFISDTSLVYHEPYASSTCEIATEILQYIDTSKNFTPFEAKALYVGILMDTKNFTVKTGVRTFESASYLRRYGLNTTEVRKLFNSDKDDYIHRSEIIKNSDTIGDNMLISTCTEKYPNIKVISSQAVDEMLNLSDITAAFVLYPGDNEICMSARSFGDINVQVIAEKLGGGGHATIAGAQLKNCTLDEAKMLLKDSINSYIEENRKD